MVKVQLEVRTGSARFTVSARAGSVRRAGSLAGARLIKGEVRLIAPAESETASFAGARDGAGLRAAAPPASAA